MKQFKKKYNYFTYLEKKRKLKKRKKAKLTKYLYITKKRKTGVILKNIKINDIKYPIYFNIKLINEFLKKK